PNGPTFEEFFDISDQDSELESLQKFGGKLAPSRLYKQYIDSPKLDFEKQKVSSLSATCLMATSFGSMITHMLLLEQTSRVKSIPHSYEFDLRALMFTENKEN
ncbi:MAG: dinucleotide-utilizing protein, partial [Pseudomonas sp.]|nr:dinucleotide-utilizing protein [Pseudomonas sp.]